METFYFSINEDNNLFLIDDTYLNHIELKFITCNTWTNKELTHTWWSSTSPASSNSQWFSFCQEFYLYNDTRFCLGLGMNRKETAQFMVTKWTGFWWNSFQYEETSVTNKVGRSDCKDNCNIIINIKAPNLESFN